MIRGVRFGIKMASADVMKRLETRAIAAEQMIQMLRSQINEIKSFSTEGNSCSNEDNEIQNLATENEQLKKQILAQKNLLVAAESKAGISQVTSQLKGIFMLRGKSSNAHLKKHWLRFPLNLC